MATEERDEAGPERVELGGRTFVPTPEADIVFEQYGFIQRAAAAAGLGQEMQAVLDPKIDAIRAGAEIEDGVWHQMSERILMRAFEGRDYLDILAGILVEEGREWTRDDAEANREFFARLKGDDIRRMHGYLIEAVVGFFLSGLVSSKTSERSTGPGPSLADISLSPKRSAGGASGSESTPT